jgi:hypothetical protein
VADGGSAFTVPRPTNAAVHEGAPSGTGDGLSEVSIAPPSPWPGMPLRRHRRRPTGDRPQRPVEPASVIRWALFLPRCQVSIDVLLICISLCILLMTI